jgi:hypothetical protein
VIDDVVHVWCPLKGHWRIPRNTTTRRLELAIFSSEGMIARERVPLKHAKASRYIRRRTQCTIDRKIRAK